MTREEAERLLKTKVRTAVQRADPRSREERLEIVRACVDEWAQQVAPGGALVALTGHGPQPKALALLERLKAAGRRVVWVRLDWEEPEPCSVPIVYVGREAHTNWGQPYPPPWTPRQRR